MQRIDRDNIEDIFPMSDVQQGMMFHSLKDKSSSTFHDQNLFDLVEHDFDFHVFQNAIALMVEKHAILRTVFNLVDYSEPVQIVLKTITPDITFQELHELNDERSIYAQIRSILDEDRKKSFELNASSVLWRMKLLKVGKDEICVMFLFHHSIFDGWSTSSFITEVHNIYKHLKADIEYRPVPLRSTYKEYVAEQMAYKKSASHKKFWTEELSGYRRYTIETNIRSSGEEKVGYYSGKLGTDLLIQARKQCKAHGFSIKSVCLTAYLYSLKLFSSENDILIGLMGSNRPLCEDSDKVLGCFLNALPFRVNMASCRTWLDLVRLVDDKHNLLSAYNRFSFFEIVKICKEDASEQNPFYDVSFDLVDFHVFRDLKGYKGRDNAYWRDFSYEKTNALLDFEASVTFDNFLFSLIYDVSFVDKITIERMASYYERVLNEISYDVNSAIRNEDLFSEVERNKLLFGFDVPGGDLHSATTFIEVFEKSAQAYSEKIAVTDTHCSLSYATLNGYANKIGSRLLDFGVKRGEIVILYFNRGAFLLSSMIGVMKSGAAFVAIDTDTPVERQRFIIENTEARVLLTEEFFLRQIEEILLRSRSKPEIVTVCSGHQLSGAVLHQPGGNIGLKINGDDLAYVIYTSGTTGVPKGVMLHHAGLINHMSGVADFLNVSSDDVIAQTASCNFDVFVMQFLLSLTAGGGTLVVQKNLQLEPPNFIRELKARQVTILELVPSHIDRILEGIGNDSDWPGGLRYLLSTGEVLPERLVKKWYAVAPNVPLVNAYGPAETSDDVTLYVVKSTDLNPVPVGRPLPNIRIYIIDQNHRLCPVGVTGEIAVAGVAVGKGYWRDDGLTKRSFIENPFAGYDRPGQSYREMYKTGDLGYWNENGDLIVRGRLGNMVKIRGNRIELGEIESQLDKVPGVQRSLVADKLINEESVLVAYYIAEGKVGINAIKTGLSAMLPSYMLPSYYVEVTEFPTLHNGKIDKSRLPLPEIFPDKPETPAYVNEVGLIISEIWKEVLSLPHVNADDNFFDVGGHSLNLIKVNSKLNEKLKPPVSIVTLFQYPTIRTLADHLSKNTGAVPEPVGEEAVDLMENAVDFFSEDLKDSRHE